MKPILIATVGELEYGQLDKPVRYTPEFLTSLTNQKKIAIRDKHSGTILTEVVDLYYQDGGLYGITKDNIDIRNRGISPIFKDIMINEHDEYIEPITAKMESADVVKNPRNLDTFLYNSASVTVVNDKPLGGDDLGNEAELNKQIGVLQTEVNNAKKAAKKAKELLQTKENEYNELKIKYDGLETKYKGFADKEANTVESLAVKLADGDESLETVYKDMTLDQLKVLESKKQSEIAEEITNKSKELAQEDEDLANVLNKLSLEDLETLEKANSEWDTDLAEKYKNDTGFKGAGAGQKNGYNGTGSKKPPEKSEEEIQKEINENYEKFKETV